MKNTQKIYVPSLNDFQSILGCECYLDEDYNHICTLYDKNKRCISLVFSDISGTFSLILQEGDKILMNIYNEYLQGIQLDEQNQIVVAKFKVNCTVQEIKLTAWPEFLIQYNSFRDN